MSKILIVSRVALTALLFGSLQSACGGQSFTGKPDPSGGSGNEGGSGNNTAGTHTSAGKGHGGSATAGTGMGGSGTSGSGSAGSPPADACSGPSTMEGPGGGCLAYFPSWTHDSATGLCKPIIYGGCGATQNLYKTLEECQKACPGGTPNYDACTNGMDCMLASPGCCGVCDSPNVTAHDFIAYNRKYANQGLTCAGDVACGACPPPEGEGASKFFVPNCVQQQCVVEDVRTSPLSACKTDMDCRLRVGKGCCPGCNGQELIAVRSDGSFDKQVCGDLALPCDDCEAKPDPSAVAICGPDQHCLVAYVGPGQP